MLSTLDNRCSPTLKSAVSKNIGVQMISLEKVAIKFARDFIRPLIPKGAYARFVYLWHAFVDRGGDLDWPTLLANPGLDPVLREMLVVANEIHGEGGVSNYWAALNLKNAQQLTALGFDKFKQTIALNYFTIVSRNNYQLQFFKAHLSIKKRKRIAELAKAAASQRGARGQC